MRHDCLLEKCLLCTMPWSCQGCSQGTDTRYTHLAHAQNCHSSSWSTAAAAPLLSTLRLTAASTCSTGRCHLSTALTHALVPLLRSPCTSLPNVTDSCSAHSLTRSPAHQRVPERCPALLLMTRVMQASIKGGFRDLQRLGTGAAWLLGGIAGRCQLLHELCASKTAMSKLAASDISQCNEGGSAVLVALNGDASSACGCPGEL